MVGWGHHESRETSQWEENYFNFRNCCCLTKMEELYKMTWPWLAGPTIRVSAVEEISGVGATEDSEGVTKSSYK